MNSFLEMSGGIDVSTKLGSVIGAQDSSNMPHNRGKLPSQRAFYNLDAKGGVSFGRMARLFVPDCSRFVKDSRLQKLLKQLENKNGYIDFLLFSVTEQNAEKYQIFDVVGDEYAAYFFGKRPTIYVFAGAVYNTVEDNWRHALLHLYSEILRGSRLQKFGRYVTVYYDGLFVIGSMLSLSQELRAETQTMSTFTFELLVKRIEFSSSRLKFDPNDITFADGNIPGYAQPGVSTQTTIVVK